MRRGVDVRPVPDLPQRVAEPPPQGRVVAVLVSYGPDATLTEVITAALDQCDKVVLVDNGSDRETIGRLRDLTSDDDRAILIENSENLGLAKAQPAPLSAHQGRAPGHQPRHDGGGGAPAGES